MFTKQIQIKRIYDKYQEDDGYRIFVDKLWPRGIAKKDFHCDLWIKTLAPSNELRKLFHANKDFRVFANLYLQELNENKDANDFIQKCKIKLQNETITLVYASKDSSNNNAVVLQKWLINKLSYN